MTAPATPPLPVDALPIKPSPANSVLDAYYDAGRKEYLLKNQRGAWLSLTEGQFKRMLRQAGIRTECDEGLLSEADEVILDLQHNRDVNYAGPLAGARAGFYDTGNSRILVTSSPKLIEPRSGAWPVLNRLMSGLFTRGECDQLPYVFGWLKVAIEALRAGALRPGQALVIAGEHDCGKSLFQALVTLILGGRSAKPYQFLTGATTFNSELFGAEHLMLEDEQASTDLRARRNIGAQIKNLTVNEVQSCHGKNREAVMLRPFWRLTITLNDEPENLMVLPPMDDSLTDKIILLRGFKSPMPMPTATLAQRKMFMDTLISELPALVHFLDQWPIPPHLASERFGITHYHHSEILAAIDSLAPEFRLLNLIDAQLFSSAAPGAWHGSAEDLERLLTGPQSVCRQEAQRLLHFNTACGVYLGRLRAKYPDRVSYERDDRRRTWRILPPS